MFIELDKSKRDDLSGDYIRIDSENLNVDNNDDDAYPFFIYDNIFYIGDLDESGGYFHFHLRDFFGLNIDRNEMEFDGRLWKDSKVITFWIDYGFPDVFGLKMIVDNLKGKIDIEDYDLYLKYSADYCYKINIMDYIKRFEGLDSDKIDDILDLEYTELVGGSEDSYDFKEEAKELKKKHIDSPLNKNVVKGFKGFGSDKNKGDIPVEWKQAHYTSEKKVLKFKDFYLIFLKN